MSAPQLWMLLFDSGDSEPDASFYDTEAEAWVEAHDRIENFYAGGEDILDGYESHEEAVKAYVSERAEPYIEVTNVMLPTKMRRAMEVLTRPSDSNFVAVLTYGEYIEEDVLLFTTEEAAWRWLREEIELNLERRPLADWAQSEGIEVTELETDEQAVTLWDEREGNIGARVTTKKIHDEEEEVTP